MVPRAQMRASHEDRDRVIEVLTAAAGDGRLTPDELDERVGTALTARTYGDLAVLVSDLPAGPAPEAPAPAPAPKEVVRIECVGSSTRREGPWLVPPRIEMRVQGGSVTLDLTSAVLSGPSLQIDANIRGGSLKLVTRPGIFISTDDLVTRGSSVKVREQWDPATPVRFRVDVSGTLTGSSIKARPPRRTFWQWLLRTPVQYAALPPGQH